MRKQLAELRKKMIENGIDVYIVSDKDEHLNEYTGAHFCALAEFSGFTGGDGTLVLSLSKAALWTDGRYYTQAEQELEGSGITLMRSGEPGTPSLRDWILKELPADGTLGFDGKCTSYYDGLAFSRTRKGNSRAVSDYDLCGMAWKNRPAEHFEKCWILGDEYCGKTAAEKLAGVRKAMAAVGAGTHVISSADDIAWMLNLRGGDIPNNPVFLAYLILKKDRAVLYSDPAHFDNAVTDYLDGLGIERKDAGQVFEDVRNVESPVLIDRKRCSYTLADSIPAGSRIIERLNPAMTEKCCKNETERKNIRIAQHRDSLAVTRFFFWFRNEALPVIRGEKEGKITEWDCVLRLHELRAVQEHFLDESFPTISAYGANAAMAHYMPSPDREVKLEAKGLYLVDSGGHYLEGTTDITRTWACGELTPEERTAYTLAAAANLRLADARFPDGVSGLVLDYAARELFWRRGMNYNHGTGHGVGQVLNVHEGPAGIRYKASTAEGAYPVKEGMYISDEPGYYEPGAYGVRLENMLLAVPEYTNEYGRFLRFETCTFVPFDSSCLDLSVMSEQDRSLYNAYHERVYRELEKDLTAEERVWLQQMCAPV